MKKHFIIPAECSKCKKSFDLAIEPKYADVPIRKVIRKKFGSERICCGECLNE